MYRILYHHRTKALDGQRVHIREIQDALRRAGHQVFEVSPVAAHEEAGTAGMGSFRRRMAEGVSAVTPRIVYELLMLAYNVVAFVTLVRAIKRMRPDFLYERYGLNAIAGTWAARVCRIPVLLEVNSPLTQEHGEWAKLAFPRLAQKIENYVVTRADCILAVTEVLRRMLLAQCAVPAARVRVLHNGVRTEAFAAARQRREWIRTELGVSDRLVIGAVAFFVKWHGTERLIDWLAKYQDTDRVSLLLVGDGQAVPTLREQIARLGVENRVLFTGAIPHSATPGYIAAMDLVVLPRVVSYASPLKLFEYLAAGIPIVAPRQPNVLEIVEEGVNAVCFKPDDPDDLVRAVSELLDNGALRNRLSKASAETIARRGLTWDDNAKRIIQIFESLVQQRRPMGTVAA